MGNSWPWISCRVCTWFDFTTLTWDFNILADGSPARQCHRECRGIINSTFQPHPALYLQGKIWPKVKNSWISVNTLSGCSNDSSFVKPDYAELRISHIISIFCPCAISPTVEITQGSPGFRSDYVLLSAGDSHGGRGSRPLYDDK